MTQQTTQMENVALIKQAFIDMGVLPETANDADVQDVYFKYMQANHPEVSPNIPHDINSIPRGTLLSHIEALTPTDDSDFDKLVEADADRDVLAEINAQEAETQLRGQTANNVVSGTTATVISFDSQESTPPTETEVEETENEQTDETLDESESTEGTEQSDSEADLEEAGTEDFSEAASQEEVAQESESDLSLSPQYDNADTDYDTQVTANPADADEEGEDGEPQQSPEDYGHEADEEDDGSQVN